MPDEPKPSDKSKDEEELERELDEFEAELFKAAQLSEGSEGSKLSDDLKVTDVEGRAPDHLPSEEEIEARLSRVIKEAEDYLGPMRSKYDIDDIPTSEEHDPEKPDIFDPEMRERLDKFNHTVDKIKAAKQEKARQQKRNAASEADASKGLGVGLTIAYTIIGVPLLGALVGYFIDNAMGTKSWVGICVLIGAVAGVGMGLVLMNRNNGD